MGLFSWAKSAWNSAKEKVSQAAGYIKEKAAQAVNYVRETASNMWAGFTGEKTAEEAKEKYERAKHRYEGFKSEFESKVEQITKSINETIIRINSLKTYYFDHLLVEFKHVISRVKGLQIKEHEELDGELIYTYEHDQLKGRSQIIKIDFDAHRFKNTVKAIITLGFATRKAANQSLQEAEAYDCSVSECIEKMKGELAKLENINIAILNVLSYFQCIINMAEHCIDRLKHSFAMLKNMHLVLSLPIVGGRYDGDRLPSVQLKTFELTHNLMKILLVMSKSKYINANGDIQEGEVSAARKYASQINALPIAV